MGLGRIGRRIGLGTAGGVLPLVGGACCAGMGSALVGGVMGAALAWLTPMLVGIALLGLGAVLLRVHRLGCWHRQDTWVAVFAGSYVVSALLLVPLLRLAPTGGGAVLP